MNKVMLIGRLTRDPNVRYTQGSQGSLAIARFALAVDRRDKERTADFINCTAFGKSAESIEKYLKQGTKIAVEGRIQTGSYTDRNNQKVFTTEVIIESWEFCESKSSSGSQGASQSAPEPPVGEFVQVPDEVMDNGLPWSQADI